MRTPPEICPQCGAEVPRQARACPECGSDEHSGWSEKAYLDRLGVSHEDFDYDEFVKQELGESAKGSSWKPKGLNWLWWLTALGLVVVFIWFFVFR